MPKLVNIKTALLSVSNKTDLVAFAKMLVRHDVRIISTGGTAKALTEAGIDVTAIESVTGFPEMMDGRVKTLHPKVHGGLLALRDKPDHAEALKQHDITPIDLVCVNLYPFEATVAKPDVKPEDAIEQIDIGGPSMIRSAAKNHQYVTVITDPSQYDMVGNDMDSNEGSTRLSLRRTLALAAFKRTGEYDNAISNWLKSTYGPSVAATES